jgi:preprotein translocase subunit SecF
MAREYTQFHFDFMAQRKLWLMVSALMLVVSVLSVAIRGLNFGIDFTGGTVIELGYREPVELHGVRSALETGGLNGAVAQHFGTARDVLVRLPPREATSAKLSTQAMDILTRASPQNPPELRRVEYVGPQVGGELVEAGGLSIILVLLGILIYIALRFEYRFAVGAVIATVHDPVLIIGVFSLFQIEFDLTVLAAVLAVIGYSVNDTIVVYDRIRENFRKMRKGTTLEIVNASVNQTLTRSIMTSVTTMLVVVALFFFGGEIIHGFSLALILGIVVGTYSSIYVASAAAVMLGVSRADLMPVKKEGAG